MHDVIVVGVGPAEMTAVLYASRLNLSVLMIEQGALGGQMNNTAEIENYPGFDSVMGPDLAYKVYKGVSRFGIENAYGIAQDTKDHGSRKEAICKDKAYGGKTVIIATGCIHRKLGVPDEGEFAGRGASYCAVCDDAFFRNRRLIVVGGEDSIVEETICSTQFASEVVIVHRRDKLRAQKTIQDCASVNEKISFMWDTAVEEIAGNETVVTGVGARNIKTGNEFDPAADGVFIYVGSNLLAAPFREVGLTNETGWIPTNNKMKVNIPGVFTTGDVCEKDLRQITTVAGDGGIAGQQVYKYLGPLEETTA